MKARKYYTLVGIYKSEDCKYEIIFGDYDRENVALLLSACSIEWTASNQPSKKVSKKESALKEIIYSLEWFEKRGSTLEGYLSFYKDSHYPASQIEEIFEADKQGYEIEKKRYHNLSGKRHIGTFNALTSP
jgi:hypothetical protein